MRYRWLLVTSWIGACAIGPSPHPEEPAKPGKTSTGTGSNTGTTANPSDQPDPAVAAPPSAEAECEGAGGYWEDADGECQTRGAAPNALADAAPAAPDADESLFGVMDAGSDAETAEGAEVGPEAEASAGPPSELAE